MGNTTRELFDRIVSTGWAAVDHLRVEGESLHLEFKEKSTPDGIARLGDDNKANYAKTLSAFANSDGGILIWGIEDSTGEIKAIRNHRSFIEQLRALLPDAVTPAVDGVDFFPLDLADESDSGIVSADQR